MRTKVDKMNVSGTANCETEHEWTLVGTIITLTMVIMLGLYVVVIENFRNYDIKHKSHKWSLNEKTNNV